jgi:PBP1b-binding outer membrane lipoprotein LpoB
LKGKIMKIPAAFAALALLLSGCATVLAPQRCQQAAAGLDTAAQIAQVLIDRGIEPAKARKLADAVVTGRMLLAAACAQAEPAR